MGMKRATTLIIQTDRFTEYDPFWLKTAGNPAFVARSRRVKPTAAQTRYVAVLARLQPRLERLFASHLDRFFDHLETQGHGVARAILDTVELERLFGLRSFSYEVKVTARDRALVNRILRRLGLEPSQNAFKRLYEGHYLTVGEEVAGVSDIIGLATDLPDPIARSIVSAGGRRAGLVDLSKQAKASLFRALEEGRAAGEGPGALARRIGRGLARGPWSTPEIRARVIARTETKFAQNMSMLAKAREAGVERILIFDGRLPTSDEDCIARDGKVVTIDQFEELMHIEHPNGTLSGSPYFG